MSPSVSRSVGLAQTSLRSRSERSRRQQHTMQGDMGASSEPVPPRLYGGVDRSHGRSLPTIGYMLMMNYVGVVLSAWIAFSDTGPDAIVHALDVSWPYARGPRTTLLFLIALLYALRATGTLLVWLKRPIVWSEAAQVGTTLMLFFPAATAAGAFRTPDRSFGVGDVVAFVVALIGFSMTLVAELQRFVFKQDPANKGRLFKRGLNAWVQHPNYVGDSLLFLGWAALTAEYWFLLLPFGMILAFIFVHSPGLRTYLREHYASEYPAYEAVTKKFIPGIF